MAYNKNLLKVLCELTTQADFKSVEKKFIDQNNKTEEVKKYINSFKELRDSHRIPQEYRDIDLWGHKSFKDFRMFIDTLIETSSKSSVKKVPHKKHNIEGATFITENEDWLVYKIQTFKASELLGSRNWCIVRREDEFDSYTKFPTGEKKMDFYYILSKNKNKDDRWYKIAMAVELKGGKYYWDNSNVQHLSLPSSLNIPSFKTK